MPRLVVDPQTRAKLHNLDDRLELCDEGGRVLGVYLPLPDSDIYRSVKAPVTQLELDQSEREPARPLADILRDLEAQS